MENPFPFPNPSPAPDSQQQPQTLPINYQKGNWTAQESLTLITAKRLHDDPFRGRRSSQPQWKWIENYCCAHGCLRSQNQCKNKWDNLLREYKKVYDYESRNAATEPGTRANRKSYWEMERHERKEFNLPTNLGFDIHESLTAVFSLGNVRRIPVSPTPIMMIPPQQPPKDLSPPPAAKQAAPQTEDSAAELDGSVEEEREMKRSKARDLGTTTVRTAPLLSQTLMTSEENKQRHKELMELEERKLRLEERRMRLEEERSEMKKQAVSGLLSAINGLSSAVHTLVSEERRAVEGGGM